MSTITTIEEKLRAISPELEDFVAFVQVVQSATKIGGAPAATGLAVIDAALRALQAKTAGTMTHADFLAEILKAHDDLKADRVAEDAELAALKAGA